MMPGPPVSAVPATLDYNRNRNWLQLRLTTIERFSFPSLIDTAIAMPGTVSSESQSVVPNCRACRYYYITWDEKFPHGCKAMRFKSRRLPHLDVLESSGTHCLLFLAKETERRE